MHDEIKGRVKGEQRNRENDWRVSRNTANTGIGLRQGRAVGTGCQLWIGISRHDDAVDTDVRQAIMHGDQGDEHERQTHGPLDEDEEDEEKVGGTGDDTGVHMCQRA